MKTEIRMKKWRPLLHPHPHLHPPPPPPLLSTHHFSAASQLRHPPVWANLSDALQNPARGEPAGIMASDQERHPGGDVVAQVGSCAHGSASGRGAHLCAVALFRNSVSGARGAGSSLNLSSDRVWCRNPSIKNEPKTGKNKDELKVKTAGLFVVMWKFWCDSERLRLSYWIQQFKTIKTTV